MKLAVLGVILVVASCAPARVYRPEPLPAPAPSAAPSAGAAPAEMPGRVTNPTKPASNYSQDAVECERKAALSQVGGRGEAFAACMRARGYSAGR